MTIRQLQPSVTVNNAEPRLDLESALGPRGRLGVASRSERSDHP